MRLPINLLLPLALAILVACGDKNENRGPSPAEIVSAQEQELFKSTSPFTLNCRGNYSWTADGKTDSGTQSFSISVSPQQGVAYVHSFEADGFLNRTHMDMNNEVRKITGVTSDTVSIGRLELDRKTLKYKYSLDTSGLCSKADENVPIPTHKF